MPSDVGPTGGVVALERSSKFINAMKERIRTRGLTNVKIFELDLMSDVLSFVAEPRVVVGKIAGTIKRNGVAIFHEYGHYETWRYFPRIASLATRKKS